MTDSDTTFSAGETKLLITILRHCDGTINANWDAVAEAMGYKDASIAKTRWGQIKKKKINGEGGADAAAGSSPAKVRKPRANPKKKAGKKTDKVDSGNEELIDGEAADGGDDDEKKVKKEKVDGHVKEEAQE